MSSLPPIYAAESKRLYLQPLVNIDDHLEDYHELWSNEEIVRWTIKTPKLTILETAAWMPTILPTAEIPDIDKFAIILKSDFNPNQILNQQNSANGNENENRKLKCIGILGTNRWSDQGLETGYVINRHYWGKGYATEAVGCFLKWFWEQEGRKGVKRLVGKVYEGNEGSIGVLRKCGGWEGEVLKGVESKAGGEADLICFYFERPVEKSGEK